ncbi:MAG: stalk domain-containing protein [Candidatus Ornithomonoglobus sp.]
MNRREFWKKSTAVLSAVTLLFSVTAVVTASDLNGTKSIKCEVGDNLTIGEYAESAAETQRLIDARPDIQRRVEDMGRGLVAVTTDNGVFVSWRWKGTESIDVKYNIYRNGKKLNSEPLSLTNYTDIDGTAKDKYSVSAVTDGGEGERCEEVTVWDGYLEVPIESPAPEEIEGATGYYTAGDASAADLDGDGEYEIILKWNAIVLDASKTGYTNVCYIDAYKLDGTRLWRISMGPNIRSGEHDTQFMCADFDGDGKAEMAVRTADGTIAGDGSVIGDADADWYKQDNGKNLKGPLYITVFNGEDGSVIDTTDYWPQSTGTWSDGRTWDIGSWGDDYGNRSERYLGAIASFDGVNTSFILSRGYYDRTCIGAWHLEDGKIVTDWTFDSHDRSPDDDSPWYSGQGYHNMATADVDYDGKDEVVFGNLLLDHDGTPVYSTGLGHGDSQHVGDLVPSRPGLEVYTCQEYIGADYGFVMRDARTGEFLYGMNTGTDNGRACTADIDPAYEGEEAWSAYGVLTAADGTVISTDYSMPANFAIYWDGDLGREIEDGNGVYKWNSETEKIYPIFKAVGAHSINATKSNPSLQADLFGDWREELIFPSNDGTSLRIYTTTIPTAYRIPTLTSDSEYYNAVAWQNSCYNQTTHLGYYLGYDTEKIPVPQVFTAGADGEKVTNPDLKNRRYYSIDELYFGDSVALALDNPTALVNGAKTLVDEDNDAVSPYLDETDRTMVPLRFISEAFGAKVDYDEKTEQITIESGGTVIKLTPGESKYTVNGAEKETDTVPVIKNERTFVPVRIIAETLGKTVEYYDGLIYISTLEAALEAEQAEEIKEKLQSTKKAVKSVDYAALEDYGNPEVGITYEVVESITSDGTDASALYDRDEETSWTCPAGGEVVLNKGNWYGSAAVVLCFGDDKQHKFRIEYSGNGVDWQIALADRTSDGEGGVYEKYYFGCPLYPTYLKYVSEDDTDTVISEFGVPILD